jgi:diguanylate cyclase (GGDEF)-like protein
MNMILKPQWIRYVKYTSIALLLVFSVHLMATLIITSISNGSNSINQLNMFAIALIAISMLFGALLMLRRALFGASLATFSGLLYMMISLSNTSIQTLNFHVEYVIAIGVFSIISFAYDKEIKKKNVELTILKHKIEHIEQNHQITKSMMEITPKMLLDDDLDKLLDRILKKAIELIPRAQSGSILIKQGDIMEFRAAVGYSMESLKKISLHFEDMFQYKIGNLYEPAVIQDIKTFNEQNLNMDMTNTNVLEVSVAKSVLTCAITLNKEIYGFINLDNLEDRHAFQNQDKLLIKHLAQQIEISLKNHALVEEIYKMSQRDSLTGAYSRQHHEKLIQQIHEEARINLHRFCIVVIDVNDLKRVNDTYGHLTGDHYLVHFAKILKAHLEPQIIFSRTGGDEFVLVFPNCDAKCGSNRMSVIQKMFQNQPLCDGELEIEVSFGWGIACYPDDGNDLMQLMKTSDMRMYENKRLSKLHT